jgi:hypothetical protein
LKAKTLRTVSKFSIGGRLEHIKASLTWVLAVHILAGFFTKIPRFLIVEGGTDARAK